MRIWFTSDTHFGSERALEHFGRPFTSVEEMNKSLIRNLNKFIKKDDIVYHLGGFGNYDIISELNGNYHLIFGNCEQKDLNDRFHNDIDAFKKYLLNVGFVNMSTECGYCGDIQMIYDPEKCPDKSGQQFYLFGHIREKLKPYGLNVSIDVNNYVPIDKDTIFFYKKSKS